MDSVSFEPLIEFKSNSIKSIRKWGVSKIRSCENACFYRYLQCFQGVGGSWGVGVSIYIYIDVYIDLLKNLKNRFPYHDNVSQVLWGSGS